jgi:hypothetical protein
MHYSAIPDLLNDRHIQTLGNGANCFEEHPKARTLATVKKLGHGFHRGQILVKS